MGTPVNGSRHILKAPDPESCGEQWFGDLSPEVIAEQTETLEHAKATREWLKQDLQYSLTDFTDGDVVNQFDPHRHGAGHISNQFEFLLTSIIMPDNSDAQIQKYLSSLQVTTVGEELVLQRLLGSIESRQLLSRMREYWGDLDLAADVQENLKRARSADRYQFSEKSAKRPLERCVDQGVVVTVPAVDRQPLAELIHSLPSRGPVPILEHLKNRNLLEASGFMAGKASLAIHDALDHVWLFQLVEDSGLFTKFEHLWDGVGSPRFTDVFKREGEAISSIGFGTRYWANIDAGFVSLVTVGHMCAHMEEMFQVGALQERHFDAFRQLRDLNLRPLSREAQSLGFVFSNYLVELDEQRRKYGRIQFRQSSSTIVGELNPWSADYISFFVEVHHLLSRSKYKHRYTTFRVNHLLEEWLFSDAASSGEELKIDLSSHFYWQPELPPGLAANWSIPSSRVQWIAEHPGFTAIRDALRW